METVYRNNAREVLYREKALLDRDIIMDGSVLESVKVENKPFWNKRFMEFYSNGIHTKALALQCAQLEELESCPARTVKLFPADIRKVHLAREILLHDLQHPPSMTLLARQSGLNTFKLKAGFKQVYGNSVFGYLKDYRLGQAKAMIREGGKTVTAVAYETGYSTLQHFSNEFKKKFGMSPKEVKGH
jgi:AraC-like DNA-binding protein